MIKRFYKMNDNVYRGSAPSSSDIADLQERFGIKKIVSLDEMVGKKIDRMCKLLGIDHVIIPVDAAKVEPMAQIMELDVCKLLEDGGPTYVHCLEGKDRTGMLCA